LAKSEIEEKKQMLAAMKSGKKKKSVTMSTPPPLPKVEEKNERDGTIVEMPENSDDDNDGLGAAARVELPPVQQARPNLRKSATMMKPKTAPVNVPRKSNMDQLADQIKGRWADINKNLGKDEDSSENESSSEEDDSD